jgi:RimJ/RimL family protein N-acetyltransferase
MTESSIQVRRASPQDADGIAGVLGAVARERVHSAIERPWTATEQRTYLASLSPREAFHVATAASGEIVGYQSLDLYSSVLSSMAHVGALGTFLLPVWRGRGVGRALFTATRQFAEVAGYRKFVIQVRASNLAAQRFYQQCGFRECGRLRAQVVIGGATDDEVVMEFFLTGAESDRPAP